MAQYEIERKWSFSKDPREFVRYPLKEDHVIYQWYLVATDDAQVRVSQRKEIPGDRYTLNIKTGNGLIRKEVRIDITYKDFLALTGQCDNAPIKKHLYCYNIPGNRILEVSQVDDDWWYAEVEFTDEDTAKKFNIFDVLRIGAEAKDVTGDSQYAMKNYWRKTHMEGK